MHKFVLNSMGIIIIVSKVYSYTVSQINSFLNVFICVILPSNKSTCMDIMSTWDNSTKEWSSMTYCSHTRVYKLFEILSKFECYTSTSFLHEHFLLWHLTPASSSWLQLWMPTPPCEQFKSALSVPEQPTLSSKIGPYPGPKAACGNAAAPEKQDVER